MIQPGTIDAVKMVMQYGYPAVLLMLAFAAGSVIYAWLVRANPVSAMRGLMTVRKRRLERICDEDFLTPEARTLAERDLSQKSLQQLTGLFDHRLQRAGVALCFTYDLHPRYLRPWRTWLTVRDRQIEFSKRWYRAAWYYNILVNLPFSTVVMGVIAWACAQEFGELYAAPVLLLNAAVWWFPWLMFTAIPTPRMTRQMETYLQSYNSSLSDATEEAVSGPVN